MVPTKTYAQTGSVGGRIMDGNSPLPGAAVNIKDKIWGNLSNEDGYFKLINIPIGKYTIRISYLGYKAKEIDVEISKEPLDLGTIQLLPDIKDIEAIKVRGDLKTGSESKAINRMKNSDHVVSVISAETISKLPSKNAAEAAKRMGGVVVQNNKGEGSMISLRGTPADWTSTLVNGDRMPVADEENTSRTFEFEAFPSDLIDYVEISRSVTPDMEGDNIGGAINFITKSSVDKKTLKINIGGGYNVLAQKPIMNVGLLWGNRSKNGKFSYVINASYYGRYYGAQAFRVVYGSNFNQGIASYELKDYSGMRNTVGANAALEYKISRKITVGANFIYGIMLDDKRQRKTRYNYTEGSGARVRLQTIHGILVRQFYGGDIHANYQINDKLRIEAKIASYYNSFTYGKVPFKNKDPRNGYFFVEFISPLLYYKDVDAVDFYGNAIEPGSPNMYITKLIGDDNPYGHGDHYNNIQPQPVNPQDPNTPLAPNNYEFYQAFSELNRTWENDPIVAKLDFHYRINNNIRLQFGTKMRYKYGGRDISLHQWIQNTSVQSQPFLLTDFQTVPFDERGGFIRELGSNYNGTFMPFLSNSQTDNFVQQLDGKLREYTMQPQTNQEYRFWAGSKYTYEESVYAGYAMIDAKLGKKLSLVGGLRMEYTMLMERSDTLLDSLAFDPVSGNMYNVPEERITDLKYAAWLPALNVNWSINNKSNLRFAISRTFHRPNFEETKPGFGVYRVDELNLTFGNSKLKPSYSLNFDVMYEYYWGNKGMFSIGGYYKCVTDHIFAITTSYVDQFGIVAKRYDNAPESYVFGFEANFMRKFDFLPKFLSGFGINANITYSYSRMRVPGRSKAQAMTEQTPLLYNIALFYEKYGFSARLGLNYNGPYLKELNLASVQQPDGSMSLLHKDANFDIFKGENYSLDFLASYEFKKYYTVYIELANLLDYPDLVYRGKKERPIRTEYYRQRGQIGFKYEF